MPLQTLKEFLERNLKRVGTNLLQGQGQFWIIFHPAELAHVVVDKRPVRERKNGAGIFRGRRVPKQPAGHAEVNINDTAFEFEKDLLPMPAHINDPRIGKRLNGQFVIAARDTARAYLGRKDLLVQNVRGVWNALPFRLQEVQAKELV